MVPAGEGFGLPKEPAGEPMKPFDLPKRGALAANETMPGHVAGGAANDLRSYLQRSVVLRSRALAEASRRERADRARSSQRQGETHTQFN